jgi:hypothetical protein
MFELYLIIKYIIIFNFLIIQTIKHKKKSTVKKK